jgi:cell envelope opacity-associated protein A
MLCRMALDDGAGNSLSALTNGQSLELTSSNLLFKLS